MKSRRCLTVIAGLGAVVLAATFATQGVARAGDDKTYTIAPKYTTGEVVKFKMKSNMNMEMTTESGQSPFPGGEMVMNMSMKYRTKKVDDAGTATVVMTVTGGEMSFMGQTMPVPEAPPITMEMDKRGISKNIAGLDKAPGMQAMSQMFNMSNMPSSGFFFPDHPVKVGESWDAELPSFMGPGKMKVSSQLLSVDMVDGKEMYKVKQTWTMPMEVMIGQAGPTKNASEAMMVMSGTVVSAGDVELASDSGRIHKMLSDIKGTITMEMKGAAAQQSPFGSKMTMKMGGKAEMALAGVGTAADEPEETIKPSPKPVAGAKKPTSGGGKVTTTKKPVKKP
jgi:hypothetical protein